MARRKGTTRKYTKAQRQEIVRRIASGETQVAVAAATGVPLATVGYWARNAKKAGAANGAMGSKRKRGRPAGSRNRASASTKSASAGIAWALDGDTLVIRIPLRVFARRIAAEALEKI